MAYTLGDRIDDWVRLSDANGAVLTGVAAGITITAQETDGPGSFGAVSIVETTTPGTYRLSFTPSAAGEYFLGISHPSAVPANYSERYVVEEAGTTLSTVTSSAGATRQRLRRDVARKLGDLHLATATETGSTSTFIDRVRMINPARAYVGATAYVTAGTAANVGQERRIIGSTADGILTLQYALPAVTAPGDQAEILNDRGQGWGPEKIHDLLNQNIRNAAPLYLEEITATLVGSVPASSVGFALDVEVTLPTTFFAVYAVEYQDWAGNWQTIAGRRRTGEDGFWLRPGNKLVVGGSSVWDINGGNVTVYGYGLPSELTSDADITGVNAEWLIERTCADLQGEASHHARVPDTMRDAAQRGQRADALRGRVRTLLKPNTVFLR